MAIHRLALAVLCSVHAQAVHGGDHASPSFRWGLLALTSASMACRMGSGRPGQRSTIKARSGSIGTVLGDSAPESAPPLCGTCVFLRDFDECSDPGGVT